MRKFKLKCQYPSIQVFHGPKIVFRVRDFHIKISKKKRRIYSQNSPFQGKSKTKLVLLVVIFDRLYFENGQNLEHSRESFSREIDKGKLR